MMNPIEKMKKEMSIEYINEKIHFFKEMRGLLIEQLRKHSQEQVENFFRDSKNMREFYLQFIKTLPSAFDALFCVGIGSRREYDRRFKQQLKIEMEIFESRESFSSLIQVYLTIAKYRDMVERILDFIRPFA